MQGELNGEKTAVLVLPSRVFGFRVCDVPREALRGGIPPSFSDPFCGHLSPKIDRVS